MKRIKHNESHWVFPFLEYVPENNDGNLPLIIQLHGAGEKGLGDTLDLMDVHGFGTLMNQGKDYPCRVVMPQCPPDTFWTARVESLVRFVNQIKESFPTDEKRIYLTGLSMGGFGTWDTAMAAPELFAAIAPVCGGGLAWHAGVLAMPIWTFHGTEDAVVLPVYTEMMVDAVKSHGGDIKYTRIEGLGHMFEDLEIYNEELLNWLLSKSKLLCVASQSR